MDLDALKNKKLKKVITNDRSNDIIYSNEVKSEDCNYY
jgi:hypothetical protein